MRLLTSPVKNVCQSQIQTSDLQVQSNAPSFHITESTELFILVLEQLVVVTNQERPLAAVCRTVSFMVHVTRYKVNILVHTLHIFYLIFLKDNLMEMKLRFNTE